MSKKILNCLLGISLSSLSFLTLLPYFDNFENSLQDKRFRNRYTKIDLTNSIEEIVVVDIDSRSIKKMGKYHSWQRDFFAQTIDALANYQIGVVGFDLLLDKSPNPTDDAEMQSALDSSNFVFLGYNFTNPDPDNFSYPDTLLDSSIKINQNTLINDSFYAPQLEVLEFGSKNLHNVALGSGFVNMNPDNDGVTRKTHLFYRYFNRLYPSLALQLTLKAIGANLQDIELNNGHSISIINPQNKKQLTIPLNPDNSLTIHYQGPWKTFRTISFYDVMEQRVGRKAFKDKIALVGASLPGLYDLKTTPVAERFPGVEIHANVINTILKQNWIRSFTKQETALIMLLSISIICLLFLGNLKTRYAILLAISYISSYVWLSFYLFNSHNILIDQFHVIIAMLISVLFSYLIKYFIEERDKRFIKNTLGRYVPEVISKAMLEDASKLKLGGERKEISMFFSDIRDFTKISEAVSPEILVAFLNSYLSKMTKIIKENQGTLDKFMGDAIICFFGAPIENNHPYFACKTALQIVEALQSVRDNSEHAAFREIKIGIGINTGEVTVGNIGSMELFDYTAIGDNMNLASRLEGLNKYYGTTILVSDSTMQKTKNYFIFRPIDSVIVKGKNKPVKLFELLAETQNPNTKSTDYSKISHIYESGLLAYQEGDFASALIKFQNCIELHPNDQPSILLHTRTQELIKNPPNEWSGNWSMTDK